MDSIDYFDKRDPRSKVKKDLDVEWNDLKKVRTEQKKDEAEKKLRSPSKSKKKRLNLTYLSLGLACLRMKFAAQSFYRLK